MPNPTPARLLFVHAHPDDETLTTGLTMAAYASRGHDVHLLTCTLGEEGEVIPPALAHLAADRDDTLGPWRKEELRSAMSVLSAGTSESVGSAKSAGSVGSVGSRGSVPSVGSPKGVTHSVLGEDPARGVASRYRDSGMAGTPSARHRDAFARADLDEAAGLVAAHIRALRPHIVVTYDEHGGYAHPDHIQTHRVTMLALARLAEVPDVFCILTPLSWAVQDRVWLQQNVDSSDANYIVPQQDAAFPPSVVRDEIVTHVIKEPDLVDLQGRVLAQHATQVVVHDGFYALSNHITSRLSGREAFAQFDPTTGHLVRAARGELRHTGLVNVTRDRG